MKHIAGFAFGFLLASGAPVLAAQPAPAPSSAPPAVAGRVEAPMPRPVPPVEHERPVLFRLAGWPVRLWAPVPPPYDDHANQTPAANPRWLANPSAPGSAQE